MVGIGQGKSVWELSLAGNSTTGTASFTSPHPDGGVRIDHVDITGTLSATALSFAANVSRGCSLSLTGTANVADSSITGTYSGSNICGGAITNGRISLSKATLTGTWSGFMGQRSATWQLSQSGDGGVAGSISGWRQNPPGPQSVSGTFSNTTLTLTFTSSYVVNVNRGGTCQETLTGTAKLGAVYVVPNFRPPVPDAPTAQLGVGAPDTFEIRGCDFSGTKYGMELKRNLS